MTWGKSILLTIPLVLSGIFVVPSPATAATRIGSATDWALVANGANHTCGIRDGTLYCWGSNASGQVGNGGDGHQDAPDDIGGQDDWTDVSAGDSHTCGIRDRYLYCWGDGSSGQIGNGSTHNVETPTRITSARDWKSVSAGGSHTCAIRGSSVGYLYCWGNGSSGQTGYGGVGSPKTPARVTTARDWKTVSAGGSHTCAIRGSSVGYLYCWGNGSSGQTGYGGVGSPKTPARVTTARDWKTVSAGGSHTCAIRGSSVGYLYCWGNGSSGQTGYGGVGSPTKPARITTARQWKAVSAGGTSTCATHGTGALYCWGDNTHGQVYDASTAERFLRPYRLYGTVADFRRFDIGDDTTCATRASGALYCWGGDGGAPEPSCSVAPYARPNGIDLSHWKLTTPLDLNSNGTADEIRYTGTSGGLAELDNQYYYDKSDVGGTRFRARADGATTSEDTQYARSELREMTQSGGYDEAAWDRSSGTHRMQIHQRINHTFEEKPEVVAGQIHDGSDDVLQIRLEGPQLLVTWNDGNDSEVLDSSYTRGAAMDLLIQADECGIAVKYNSKPTLTIPVGDWDNGEWYFKAGVYNQSNTAQGDLPGSYGEVTIVGLDVDHSS